MSKKLNGQKTLLLKRIFTDIKNSNNKTMEYGESMIFMSGTESEKEIRKILDEIDALLAEIGIDNTYAAISQKPGTTQSYTPSTNTTNLKKIEHGEIGIGIERIN